MIKILLFAGLQEEMGTGQLVWKARQESGTVEQLMMDLKQEYPQMSLEHVMVAVNEEFVTPFDQIQTGDVVALIPPVSGG